MNTVLNAPWRLPPPRLTKSIWGIIEVVNNWEEPETDGLIAENVQRLSYISALPLDPNIPGNLWRYYRWIDPDFDEEYPEEPVWNYDTA